MTRSELQRLRAKVEAMPKPPSRITAEGLCDRIETIAAELDAMTPAQREAWEREHPITPEVEALSQRIEALAARTDAQERPQL